MMPMMRVLLFAVSLLAPHFRSSLRLHSLGGDRSLLCWIPAAVRSTIRSRADGADASWR
jgi:uncharacterized protein (DUF2236 family)